MNGVTHLSASLTPVWLAFVLLSACSQQEPRAVSPTGVTEFRVTISFLTVSQADCMEQVEGECTKVKVTSTNVGTRSGDANCTVRFFNRDRHQTGVIDRLITSNVAPGDSSSWVAHI